MFIEPMTALSAVEKNKNTFFNNAAPKVDGSSVFRDIFFNAIDEVRRTDQDLSLIHISEPTRPY